MCQIYTDAGEQSQTNEELPLPVKRCVFPLPISVSGLDNNCKQDNLK